MFTDYLRAGYPILWVQTHEEDRAIKALSEQAPGYQVYVWDIITGIQNIASREVKPMGDPVAPLNHLVKLPERTILFLKDFHKFISGVDVFRTIKTILPSLKSTGRHLVITSPVVNIPVELEKDITLYQFNLPTREELLTLARKIVEDNELQIQIDEGAVAAGQGLTLDEAENTFALSIIRNREFRKSVIEEGKLQTIKKSGLMELYKPVPESELGGMGNLKKYIHNRMRGFSEPGLPTPKGILLVGLPGGGKSLAAKVTASVLDFPLVRLDIGTLKGGIVGESERKMKQATDLIDAISPCVVWLEEIEKALGGVQSSNKTDGGTTSAMFGHLLTWMQESDKPKFLVATCNEIEDLLNISQGALLRRFDDIFLIDLPNLQEREDIFKIMNARYKTDFPADLTRKMEGWTGAEIEKFVKAAVYDGAEDAFRNIKPISQQNKATIEKVRAWGGLNARPAGTPAVLDQKKKRKLET